jgi:hypothetical protein
MNELKTAAGSWARAFLVAVISMAAAGVTDPKQLASAALAGVAGPLLKYLDPSATQFGKGSE